MAVIFVGVKVSVEDRDHEKIVMDNMQFKAMLGEKEICFSPFQAEKEGSYYLVLPSAYEGKEFLGEISYDDRFYSFYIDGEKYRKGEVWGDSLTEEVHLMQIRDRFENVCMEKAFQVLVSEKIPAVFVTVEAKEALFSKEEFANKQYVEKGNMILVEESGNILLEEEMERFKVRGNLTSNLEKKPFTFTLSEPAGLLGMRESRNWHLLANATDGSHIRNKIMMDWANELQAEEYHPTGEFVDLFLNGEYQGLYLLTETVEVSEQRLALDDTNSMLLEMELDYRAIQEINYAATEKEHYWVVHKEQPLGEEALREVSEYLNDIESALYSEDGRGQLTGKSLKELLDFESWTDSWLLKEISSDQDLGTTSQFAMVEDWEDRSVLVAGPEWDFDGSLGNAMVPWAREPRNLAAAIPNTKGIQSVNQNKWLSQMYRQKEFKELLVEKFVSEIQPKIHRLLETEIDAYAESIRRPALMDSLRWIGNDVMDYFAFPENFCLGEQTDYRKYDVLDCQVAMIKEFLKEKEQFLYELWVEEAEFELMIEEHKERNDSDLNYDTYVWIRKDK